MAAAQHPEHGYSIDYPGPAPVFDTNGNFDAAATATAGRQMAQRHLDLVSQLEGQNQQQHPQMRWLLGTPPPLWAPALGQHGMSKAQWTQISQDIVDLWLRVTHKPWFHYILAIATCGIYACIAGSARQKKGKEDLTQHLHQLNAVWMPRGISFNRECIPYAGTFCVIKVFDPSLQSTGLGPGLAFQ